MSLNVNNIESSENIFMNLHLKTFFKGFSAILSYQIKGLKKVWLSLWNAFNENATGCNSLLRKRASLSRIVSKDEEVKPNYFSLKKGISLVYC